MGHVAIKYMVFVTAHLLFLFIKALQMGHVAINNMVFVLHLILI